MKDRSKAKTTKAKVQTKRTAAKKVAATTTKSAARTTLSKKQNGQAVISQDLIAARAYEIWQARGCDHGGDKSDWFQAEKELDTAGR